MYFKNVEVKDEVYSLIYGLGEVKFVVPDNARKEGFFTFEVKYTSKQKVVYTVEGIPNWCNTSACGQQTVWYKNDIDLIDEDISPSEGELSKKKICKLRLKDKLEIKCPSGIWRNINQCPEKEFLMALSKEQFHLFRKTQ